MAPVAEVLAAVALLLGAGLNLLAAVGLHRFPDVFARMHGATKPATVGLVLILATAAATAGDSGDAAKLLLVIALQFLTAPVGAHVVGRAAYRTGTLLSGDTRIDELAEVQRAESSGRDG